ncbi:hypothetical protein TVAG_396700 [Trichomonas vaginalis G3]|uniref:Right handed beta helix domain-containing protein n=1 Tax=Trichomonas vaginalis (strain ATCC PRA-98 / G3) TaxID=412133 RepID=A2GEZ9_TRIV3|nr:hypothetical protein TVAGG3_0207450 [Trichomonas vaginalis G3]EAX84268.1 hypothetical protein TVAG_396700 [Trichomonas vaginalis G3]KAI5551015.1 hypothetical protein TVAGG3_0207450 [Trichomonas vaginalis G3]|eukprot:XP_001297198.1 hypothetical protein [Trichomonas vaginalis G3]
MFTRILSLEDDNIWNSYFNNQFTGVETKNSQNCDLPTGKKQYFLDECNFFDDHDRVIYFNNVSDTLFLHNQCSFSKCTSTLNGSCVYYQIGKNSSIVQRKFCCTKCEGKGNGQFSYTKVDTDNINFIIESSIFDVGNENGGSVCQTENDNVVVSSTNFSSNKASNQPAGHYRGKSLQYTTTFNYSTVVNNLATNNILNVWYKALIDSCNIINNTKTTSESGIIYHTVNSLTVKSCSFINNTTPQGSYLIYNKEADQLTVDSCYIDNSISSTFLSNVKPKNTRELFTNKLIHFSTGNCQAEFTIIKSIDKTESIAIFSHRFPRRRLLNILY